MNKILLLLLLTPLTISANPRLDVSLGSMVGDVDRVGQSGDMPFWAEGYIELGDNLIKPIAGIGHESGADTNGGEFSCNYGMAGAKLSKGLFYSKATASKCVDGELSKGDALFRYEVGIERDGFRFTAFYGEDESDVYDAHGLKFGYTF